MGMDRNPGQVIMSAKVKGVSCVLVTQSCPTLATPWTVAHQAPLSMRFSRQEYWGGWPFPKPGKVKGKIKQKRGQEKQQSAFG